MSDLYDRLTAYQKEDIYPFHMPGHKRHLQGVFDPYGMDITEIHGFDNLHNAEGIIRYSELRAAKLYNSEETHFLINGSTCGLLSAISACAAPNESVLIARNCHMSVYNALFLRQLQVEYIYPEEIAGTGICGSVDPSAVDGMLESNPSIRAVVITSPTYEGIVSDIATICRISHQHRAVLIVDEAHGAHLPFHEDFPESAIATGADLVIHSLHKTMPALTQTALLHVNGDYVDRQKLRQYLSIYQSSSPSYVLMASMDYCMKLIEKSGKKMFSDYVDRLLRLRRKLQTLSTIRLLDSDVWKDNRIEIGTDVLQKPHSKTQNTTVAETASAFLRKPRNEMPNGNTTKIHTDLLRNPHNGMHEENANEASSTLFHNPRNRTQEKGAFYGLDPSKLVLLLPPFTNGKQLYEQLREKYRIELEMAMDRYVLAMTSVMDTEEGFGRLCHALEELDRQNSASPGGSNAGEDLWKPEPQAFHFMKHPFMEHPRQAMKICDALSSQTCSVRLEESAGAVSAGYISLFPPGIPFIVPGEVITGELIERITACRCMGLTVTGINWDCNSQPTLSTVCSAPDFSSDSTVR